MSLGVSEEVTSLVDDESCLSKLRDQLEKEERIGWYVVVCGDEERGWPGMEEEVEEEDGEEEEDQEGEEQSEGQGEEEETGGEVVGPEKVSEQQEGSRR